MMPERTVVFDCGGDRLPGILHAGAPDNDTGVIIVVGGPQYRVGSHRQFVLLARRLASAGFPVLRFDFRGMGDAEGKPRSFETVDDDIRAAVDAFRESEGDLGRLVLLGLCDAASACLIYSRSDPRITGLILMNPWVRTTQSEARVYLRHYYGQRLLQKSFWKKLFGVRLNLRRAAAEFFTSLRSARRNASSARGGEDGHFVERMRVGLSEFGKPTLIVLSGRDLTAREFWDLCSADTRWQAALQAPEMVVRHMPEADHTFSGREQLENLTNHCIDWLATVSGRSVGTDAATRPRPAAPRAAYEASAD